MYYQSITNVIPMYMNESEFEELKKEYPDDKFPEYGSLEWKMMFLPSEQYNDHQRMIYRYIDINIVFNFLESIKGCTHFTPDEEFALDFLFETFNNSDEEISRKLGLW